MRWGASWSAVSRGECVIACVIARVDGGYKGVRMASADQQEPEDSFELEFSQLPGTAFHPASLWRARQPSAVATLSQRRRRYSRVAVLVAVSCIVLINSLNLTGFFPDGLPFVSDSLTGHRLTAKASGYTWLALRERPLHLPVVAKGAACPVTPVSQMLVQLRSVKGIGNSTVFVATQNMDANGVLEAVRSGFFHYGSTYQGVLVTWYLRLPGIQPVFIRGAQLDGAKILRFDGGIEQPNFANNLLGGNTLPQLLLTSTPDHGTPVAAWTSITRIPVSGCYAYQVDTPNSSTVLVFKAQTDN
jgi:hypothetical protein